MTHTKEHSAKTAMPFTLEPFKPEDYRQKTRNASIIIILIFAVTAMVLSTLLVMFFGNQEGGNFKWNLTGVGLGVLLTAILIHSSFKKQPWMAASVYGWRLKRNLMAVTNIMHHVKKAVAAEEPVAMKILRFYHLGLLHMHELDGNPTEDSTLIHEINALQERMQALQMNVEQNTLDPAWIDWIKANAKNFDK